MAAKGALPVAGGTLDQAACFVEACLFVWAERAANRAEMEAEAMRRS